MLRDLRYVETSLTGIYILSLKAARRLYVPLMLIIEWIYCQYGLSTLWDAGLGRLVVVVLGLL
jgi:hypothetical protein